ncbi:MAG: protein kinase domain-containing protein [Aggregatilineales bacterium]
MPDLIGQRIGQYEIVALLGKGGMAEVYRARQTLAGGVSRDVALKLIDARLAAAPEFIARFKREAQTLVSLSHPHILKAFDFGQYQDTVYLVMELLTGGSLAELIRQGPLPLNTILRVLDHTARALDYAHSKGLVHRDLKPQNVLLDESGNAFLTDFGIVKLLNQGTVLTQSQVAIGTPAYMAPEQWTGDALDARADLYSLGVMLFEMLTGRVPFRGDTPHRVMFQHISEAPPPVHTLRTDIPPGVDQVIATAMSKDPAQRYSTAIAMLDDFKASLGGQANIQTARPTTGATPPPDSATSASTPASGTKRLLMTGGNRALIIGIAAVLVLTVLGVGGFAISQSGRTSAATPTLAPSEGTQNTQVALAGTTGASSTATQTATVISPSDTPISSAMAPTTNVITGTPVPPTATPTLVPPTATPTFTTTTVPPTNTNLPTATPIPPTRTPTHVPLTHTPTRTPTSTWTAAPTFTQTATVTPASPVLTAVIKVTLVRPILTLVLAATNTPHIVAVGSLAPIAVNTVRPILLVPTSAPTATLGPTIAPVTANKQWKPVVQTFNGVPMVLVPPGCFQMGSTNGDTDEQPITPLCFDSPFWLDQYEVSQAQFNHFGGYAANPPGFPGDNRPVENITWAEAISYCGVRGAGLPTEAEWEYAARGPDNLVYPWGNVFFPDRAVFADNSNGQTADVSSKPGGVSWVGALDMAGNVWEWTNSLYRPYPYNADDGRELPDNNPGDLRVVRGGAWDYGVQSARGSTRNGLDPTGTYGDVGLRCAQDY